VKQLNDKAKEFVRLCDLVIAEALRLHESYKAQGLTYRANATKDVADGVAVRRQKAIDGTLRRPSEGTGWGLGKAIGEWGDDTPLYELAWDLEEFYMKEM
jgi:hypothetical protein